VSVYVICPHCSHPTVIPRSSTGKHRVCRQCYCLYFVCDSTSVIAEVEWWFPPPNLAQPGIPPQPCFHAEVMICTAVTEDAPIRSALAG
jgi:hypothetical protein